MKQNLSFTDREFRYFIGAGLILGSLMAAPTPLGAWAILILLAVPVITTAVVGWDPIYQVLGLSSKHPKDHNLRQKHWSFSNVGALDRIARFTIGGTMLATVLMDNGSLYAALLAIPVILTAVMAWDPFYALADTNTLASKQDAANAEQVDEQDIFTHYTIAANDDDETVEKAA